MQHRIFIAGGEDKLEVFRWSDDRLAQAIRETPDTRSQIGAVFLGRVERIEPSLNAAFVEIGLERPLKVPTKHIGCTPLKPSGWRFATRFLASPVLACLSKKKG